LLVVTQQLGKNADEAEEFCRQALMHEQNLVFPAPSHEPRPLATSPPGTFLAKLQNFKKFVGFSGLLDIIR